MSLSSQPERTKGGPSFLILSALLCDGSSVVRSTTHWKDAEDPLGSSSLAPGPANRDAASTMLLVMPGDDSKSISSGI